MTITDGQTANLDVEFELLDSDDDGFADIVEITGYKDPFGNIQTSDPENADTDGDGLYDDYEAGVLYTDINDHTFWKIRSNPRKVDSDDDVLDDYLEIMDLGSNALDEDTDGDRLSDGLEWQLGTDLLNTDTDGDKYGDYEEYSNEYLDAKYVDSLPWKNNEVLREINLGISKGEWAKEGHENIYYEAGQFFSEFCPLGSGRDAYVNYLHDNYWDAAFDSIGVYPGGTVASKVLKKMCLSTGVSSKFIVIVSRGDFSIDLFKAKYGIEIYEKYKNWGFTDDLIRKLVKRGIEPDKVDRVTILNGDWFVIHTVDETGQPKRVLQLIDGEKSIYIKNGGCAGGSLNIGPLGSVPYDINGFPVFSSRGDVVIDSVFISSNVKAQSREASKALSEAIKADPVLASKFTSEEIQLFEKKKWPSGYTWHHHQEKGRMQLVETKIHDAAKHVGGYAIWCRNNL